jgi:ABC-type tungstate transport system substrate-binding protein
MRTILAYFQVVNFLAMIFMTIFVLSSYWGQLQDFWLLLYSYYMILGCSGVIISAWIAIDGKRLHNYATKIRKLEQKLIDLEKKIHLIAPRKKETE